MSTLLSSPHFSQDELRCSCGCEFTGMDEEFMILLEELRVIYNKPLILSSAYRCPDYNTEVSSTGLFGPHTTRKAVDIKCSAGNAHRILEIAGSLGFAGIGVSQRGGHSSRFIHLDTRGEGWNWGAPGVPYPPTILGNHWQTSGTPWQSLAIIGKHLGHLGNH